MEIGLKQIVPKETGARIKALRQSMCMTQEKLAELADLSTPHISHLETGKKCAGVDTLMRIANALDTTFDFLLTGRNPPEQTSPPEFQKLLADCSPREAKIIREIAEALKSSLRKNM